MLKWIFDRLMALVGLLILWPVLLVVAMLIRWKMSGGPVIYRQQRVGQYGKLFTIYKFRTMRPTPNFSLFKGENSQSWSTVSVAGESRITPLGAKLRKYKLDELPELWNVLIGDMSFVGPRPDVPGYADMLEGDAKRMLQLRPGITGPASLKYRNEEEILAKVGNPIKYNDTVIWPDKVRINLYYLDRYSFCKDLQMIFCTVLGKKMEYAGEVI
jgi:lipopolysaccharide/colanic/teichoic acid biosynthesis glycosyltransferase